MKTVALPAKFQDLIKDLGVAAGAPGYRTDLDIARDLDLLLQRYDQVEPPEARSTRAEWLKTALDQKTRAEMAELLDRLARLELAVSEPLVDGGKLADTARALATKLGEDVPAAGNWSAGGWFTSACALAASAAVPLVGGLPKAGASAVVAAALWGLARFLLREAWKREERAEARRHAVTTLTLIEEMARGAGGLQLSDAYRRQLLDTILRIRREVH